MSRSSYGRAENECFWERMNGDMRQKKETPRRAWWGKGRLYRGKREQKKQKRKKDCETKKRAGVNREQEIEG